MGSETPGASRSAAGPPSAAGGPRSPTRRGRHPESADVPVLIDDVKRLGDGAFQMTRCTFFTIDAGSAVHDWVAALREEGIPFLLLGMSPVLHRPDARRTRFRDPEAIEALFNSVEAAEGLVVETAHVWLPNVAVEECLGRPLTEEPGAGRGEVIRVRYPLFQHALRFAQHAIDIERFLAVYRELVEDASPETPVVSRSEEETGAFRAWSRDQIRDAYENYLRQREDGRGVLAWRDEEGVAHDG